MNISKEDLELLQWINGFGFVTSEQVSKRRKTCQRVTNRKLQKFENVGLIRRERIFMADSSIVRMTHEGVKLIGDELQPLRKLKLGSYEHDKALVDLSLKLQAEFESSEFQPERRIRHEIGLSGVGQAGHIADGELRLNDGSKIAVELELTRKQNFRLQKIISQLQTNLSLKGVWYFCPANVADQIRTATKGDPLFTIHEIKGELS